MRYVGQEHTLTIPVPAPAGVVATEPEPVAERFLDEYERTFGSILDEELEIVCVRAIATTPLERDGAAGAAEPPTAGRRRRDRRRTEAWSFTGGELPAFAVVDRARRWAGAELDGPAIVLEQTTTTYVDRELPGARHPAGALLHRRGGGA